MKRFNLFLNIMISCVLLMISLSAFAWGFGMVKVRNPTAEDVYVKFYDPRDHLEWIPCTAQTVPANTTVEVQVNCSSDLRTVKLDSKVCRADAFRNVCYTLIKNNSGICYSLLSSRC
jgi:hypothetical protein